MRHISRTEFKIGIIVGALLIAAVLLFVYFSIEGRMIIESREDTTVIKDERLSSGWRAFQDSRTGLFGFMDDKNNLVIEAQYLEALDFYGGRAIVKVEPSSGTFYYRSLSDGVYGLINPLGEYVIPPEGLITRVDTWHYLISKDVDFWTGYGIDGNAVIKRDFVDGMGEKHGEESFYYVLPINDTLFIANDGIKSYFIDDTGKLLDDYPSFYFPVIANQEIDTIIIRPLDDRMNRLSWAMSADGATLNEIQKKESLSEGIEVGTQILSPYIGTSIFFPVFYLESLDVQSKLNQSVFETVNQSLKSNFSMENEIVDYEQVNQIDYTAQLDYDLTLVGNLMNYEIIGYWYGFGAAHPNNIWSTAYFDVTTGEAYDLDSLFDPSIDWREEIAKRVDALYLENDDINLLYVDKNTPYDARISQFKNAGFNVTFTESYMKVYYPLYEIAPYAASFPTFEIPYESVKEIMDEESGLYKALFN